MQADSIFATFTVLLVAGATTFIPHGPTPPPLGGLEPALHAGRTGSCLPERASAAERSTTRTVSHHENAAPAREALDPRPLERPDAIAVWRTDRRDAIARLARTLHAQGFTPSGLDPERGEVRGSRSTASGLRDDVLLWVDGQAGDAERLRVYADFARFERLGTEPGRRVQLDACQMQEHFARLRQALQSAS